MRLFLALGTLLVLSSCQKTPKPIELSGRCMGTTWSAVVLAPAGDDVSPDDLQRVVQVELDAVDAALSTWKDTSDLSRLNAAPPGTDIDVADVTVDLLQLADHWVSVTGGAFDPTVGPLVKLWGFGSYEETEAPTLDAIASAKALLGWDDIHFGEGKLKRTRAGVEIDVSAIAKGYSVDLAADALIGRGYNNFMIEVGGESVVHGERVDGGPWRMGVENPLPPAGADPLSPMSIVAHAAIARLAVTDVAIATSGDYRNVRKIGDRTVTHAIDPRTGHTVDHDLASVTVIAKTCATADALATAALVLGPSRALHMLEGIEGVEGLLLIRTGDPAAPLSYQRTGGLGRYKLEWRDAAPPHRTPKSPR